MTVSIDPSEVRRQATVKAQPPARLSRFPVRVVLLGGLGGAGLLAFTIGAFSFFGGLADPRVRPIRPAPVASKMPDLKDGVPALVSDAGAAAPAATVLNLPKPPAAEAAPVPSPPKAEAVLRTEGPVRAEPAAPPAPVPAATRSAATEATGSVQKAAASSRTKASPGIENAATVSGDAKPVPLIAPVRTAGPLAPARAETVRAKPAAVAALPAEHEQPAPAGASKHADRDAAPEAKAAEKKATEKAVEKAAKKPAQKVARSKAKPVAEASAEPEAAPAPAAASEPEEDGFTSKVKGGLKAIGGLFGQE